MDEEGFITKNFHYISAFVAAVIWFVRLEGKVEANRASNINTQKDVDTLRIKHENLDSKIVEQLSEVRESLARLEGAMGTRREN